MSVVYSKMQVSFLERDFQMDWLKAIHLKEFYMQGDFDLQIQPEFETRGWSVKLTVKIIGPEYSRTAIAKIDIRPQLGDDFSVVLRHIKKKSGGDQERRPIVFVFINQFTGRGATLDQVREIFWADNVRIVTMADVESQRPFTLVP